MSEADYIIVGLGSAGCVLAERLTRDGLSRVLALEAGGSDRRFWIRTPIGYGRTFHDPDVNWMFETEPDPGLDGRVGYWPRGKVLGGSSSINALVYCRGMPQDFDDWEAAGARGWGWRDVRPHFERSERLIDPDGRDSGDGPLCVSDVRREAHPLKRRFFEAAEQTGLAFTDDFNGPAPEGVGLYRITTRRGMRCSAADAFLRPAMRRRNLRVETGVMVQRIVFENGRAVGVAVRRGDRVEVLRAGGGVILAAGAVNSPKLLQLSGVGPGALLRGHGIEVVQDQPAVGGGLQDHLAVSYRYKATEPTLNDALNTWRGKALAGLRYLAARRGPLSLSVNQCGGFVRAGPEAEQPNLQLYFNPLSYTNEAPGRRRVANPDPFSGFILSFQPCRPTSRGRIDIRSADPEAPPLIRPNSLSTEADRADVIAGGRLLRAMARTPAMRGLIREAIAPQLDPMTDDQVLEDFRARAGTVFHPVGTCGMGADPARSAVDPKLRVHGLAGLRVVDASVFPAVTSGNTNAPTIMAAQRGADFILADRGARQ